MSAQAIELLNLTVTSAGALTRHRFVTAAGAHADADLYGVTQFDASAAGQEVTVTVAGTAVLEAGAAIASGTEYVIADAQGRAIAGGTAAANAGKLVRGQSAAALGDKVEVLLTLHI